MLARRVVARCAGLRARGFGVVVAAGAEGVTVVVVVVVTGATGRGAARATTRGLVFAGAGSGRGALDPLGAASGLAGSCALAGTAAASDAAATIATQRRCALAPMSTNRTLGRIDRTPGCAALQPLAHPFGWVRGAAVARRPAHPEPADGAKPHSSVRLLHGDWLALLLAALPGPTGPLVRALARAVLVARGRQRLGLI